MINDSISFRYKAILNKLIELTHLLKNTLEECGVSIEEENLSFYELLTEYVVCIDSVEPQVSFDNFREKNEQKHFNSNEEIIDFLSNNKKLYYLDYILLDKIIFYMTFLRWYLIQMKVSQYYINEATTLKSLILLLKQVKLYETTSIVIDGLYEENGVNKIDIRVNKENVIDFSVISNITGYDIPLYAYENAYTIECIEPNKNLYINDNVITPTNISTLPTQKTYIIKYQGYGRQYKASQIQFNVIIIENPYEIQDLEIKNINNLSYYYNSDNEGYVSDTWQIDLRLTNDHNIGISGKEIFFAIEEEEPFGSAISNQGNVSFVGQIPYVNNQYIDYEEQDKPNAIKLYITNSAPDYNKSYKIYITENEHNIEPLNVGSIRPMPENGITYYYQPSNDKPNDLYKIEFEKNSDFENGAIGNVIYDDIEKDNLILHIYTDFDPKYDTEEFYAINLYYEPIVLTPLELMKYKGFLNDINVTLTFRDLLNGNLLQEHIYDDEKIIINNEEYTIQNSQAHFIIPVGINDETDYYITLHPDTEEETTIVKTLEVKSNFILPNKNIFTTSPSIYYKPLGGITQSSITVNDNGIEYTIITDNTGKLLLTEDFETVGTHNLILYTNINDNVDEIKGYKYKISSGFNIEEEYNINNIKYTITIFDNSSYTMGDYIDYIQIRNENDENISLANTYITIQETQANTTEIIIIVEYDKDIQGTNRFIVNINGVQKEETFILHPTLVENLNIQSDGNLIISSIFANTVDNTELTTDLDFTNGNIYVLQTIITDPDHIDEVITQISINDDGLIYKKIKDL